MSRADLARELNLTRATASSIVGSLIKCGEVLEVSEDKDITETRTGRPAVGLRLNADHAFFLGAYLGATRVYLCAVDFIGNKRHLAARKVQPGKTAPKEIAHLLETMIAECLSDDIDAERVLGLAVSVPGVVDKDGNVLRAPPLDWQSVPLKRVFSEVIKFQNVAVVLNDANAFAIVAERSLDNDQRTNAFYILLEDGVGSCIVSDGQILSGRDGLAGEFGHIPVGKNDFDNLTGINGALENFISRRAILARHKTLGGNSSDLKNFLDKLSARESAATQVQSECIHYLSRGLGIVSSLLNPTALVIGGRASAVFCKAKSIIDANLADQLMRGTFVPKVLISNVGPEGPAVGAALLLQQRVFAMKDDVLL